MQLVINNRYFTIINILLITAAVYLGVSGIYTIVTSKLDYAIIAKPLKPGQAPSATNEPKPPMSQYQAIVDRNIFNIGDQAAGQEAAPVAKGVDLENLEQTELKLRLWGTVTRKDGVAYAVIEDSKTRQQDLYRTGDPIQTATVKLILREKVVLNVEGRDEILTMEEAVAKKSSGRASRQRDIRASKLPVSAYPRQINLNREKIESAMQDLGQLMQQATIRPHIEDGRSAGISITGIKPNAIFRKMRLRNGDVITGVNGNPIESVEDAISVFEDLSTAAEIKLEIKRRGRLQTLDYRIE
jgi:general secretion pathway protein C